MTLEATRRNERDDDKLLFELVPDCDLVFVLEVEVLLMPIHRSKE